RVREAYLYGHSLALAVMASSRSPTPTVVRTDSPRRSSSSDTTSRGLVRSRGSWMAGLGGAIRLGLPSRLAVPLPPELHARGARVPAEPPELRRHRPQGRWAPARWSLRASRLRRAGR